MSQNTSTRKYKNISKFIKTEHTTFVHQPIDIFSRYPRGYVPKTQLTSNPHLHHLNARFVKNNRETCVHVYLYNCTCMYYTYLNVHQILAVSIIFIFNNPVNKIRKQLRIRAAEQNSTTVNFDFPQTPTP